VIEVGSDCKEWKEKREGGNSTGDTLNLGILREKKKFFPRKKRGNHTRVFLKGKGGRCFTTRLAETGLAKFDLC